MQSESVSDLIEARVFFEELVRNCPDEFKREFLTKVFARLGHGPSPPIVTYDDIGGELTYFPDLGLFRMSTHIGQRKLFLTELQFLVEDVPRDTDAIIVYAGAAPSSHTGFLSDLFPRARFVLVDPNPFRIEGARPTTLAPRGEPPSGTELDKMLKRVRDTPPKNSATRLYIINTLFTNEIARGCARVFGENSVYFISDVRTNSNDDSNVPPSSIDIIWNTAQMFNWITAMRPRLSLLKFRLPFYDEEYSKIAELARIPYIAEEFKLAMENGIDFLDGYDLKIFRFFAGKINIQAWPGATSTEARLVTDGKTFRDYKLEEYERRFFYYNNIERSWVMHENPNASAELGFCHCNDCAIENYLWSKYLEEIRNKGNQLASVRSLVGGTHVRDFVRRLSEITHRPLVREDHGRAYNWFELTKLAKENNTGRANRRDKAHPVLTRFSEYTLQEKIK